MTNKNRISSTGSSRSQQDFSLSLESWGPTCTVCSAHALSLWEKNWQESSVSIYSSFLLSPCAELFLDWESSSTRVVLLLAVYVDCSKRFDLCSSDVLYKFAVCVSTFVWRGPHFFARHFRNFNAENYDCGIVRTSIWIDTFAKDKNN